MGIIAAHATFDGSVPTAMDIARRVTELVALPVKVTQRHFPNDDLYALKAYFIFDGVPGSKLELTAYVPGAVQEQMRRSGVADLPMAKVVQGANEPPGTQAVYLRGYVGQEPTLFMATAIALESLGGRLDSPIPDDLRAQYGRPIPREELKRRLRKANVQGALGCLVGLVTFPPWFAWFLITLPWRWWRVGQRARKYYAEHA